MVGPVTTDPQPRRRSRRWPVVAAIVVAALGLAAYLALPAIAAWQLRRELAARGFGDARFEIAEVAIDRIRLTGVDLGDGLALGDVELDAGYSVLWGDRIRTVTVRGARLTPAGLERFLPAGGTSSALPFEDVRCARCELVAGDAKLSLDGRVTTTTTDGTTIEFVARAPSLDVGPGVVDEVVVRSALAGGRMRTCVTGLVADAAVEACTGSPPATLASDRAVDVQWSARDAGAGWHATGEGRVTWGAGRVELAHGKADVAIARTTRHSVRIEAATVTVEGSGRLDELALELRGRATAAAVACEDTTARDVQMPFVARAELRDRQIELVPDEPLTVTARLATLELAGDRVTAIRPVVTLRDLRSREVAWQAREARWRALRLANVAGTLDTATDALRWRASEARWAGATIAAPSGSVARGTHLLRWRSATKSHLSLGPGELELRVVRGRVEVTRGGVEVAGGRLAILPFTSIPGHPIAITLAASALELRRIVGVLSAGRIEGSGVVDGKLAVQLDDDDWRLTRASLHARGAGTLRVRDPAWRKRIVPRNFALHERVAGALADFRYTKLEAVVATSSAEPDVRVALAGTGARIPQQIDLVVNVRGVRDIARRIIE